MGSYKLKPEFVESVKSAVIATLTKNYPKDTDWNEIVAGIKEKGIVVKNYNHVRAVVQSVLKNEMERKASIKEEKYFLTIGENVKRIGEMKRAEKAFMENPNATAF